VQQQFTDIQQQLEKAETARAETQQRLEAALVAVTKLKGDFEGKLEQARAEAVRLQSQKQHLAGALERASAQVTQLQASKDELEQQLSGAKAALGAAEQATADTTLRLNASALETQRLEQDLARSQEVNSSLESRLAVMQQALDEKEEEVAAILGRLPAPEGGSITIDEAKASAAADAEGMLEARRAAVRSSNPASRTALREAEGRLHRSQLLVARTSNARSVYRVRSNDTLALVSQKFYGNGNRWTRIAEANRHILPDPDHLTPGLTLVIP
jgi:nucleoid-associated protein YgaU